MMLREKVCVEGESLCIRENLIRKKKKVRVKSSVPFHSGVELVSE